MLLDRWREVGDEKSAQVELSYDPPAKVETSTIKRGVDIVGALVAILLFLPLLILVSAAIWVESGSPIVFRQKRTGHRGQVFHILKFRTMTVLEEGDKVRAVRPGDVRVTRVGAVLRKLSIDELPQLVNVLRGEMSLVGPRPHALAHDYKFMLEVPNYADRFRARPGITGLAQVTGLRGEIVCRSEILMRTAADNRYIDNWSLVADLRIIARTAVVLFTDPHAF